MRSASEEFVEKFTDYWRDPSPDRLPDLLHPDVVLRQPLAGPMFGLAAAQRDFGRFLACLPGLHGEVDRWCADGDLVFIEFRLRVRLGRDDLEWPNVNRLILREGKAVERVTYFDALSLVPALLRHPSVWWRWLTC